MEKNKIVIYNAISIVCIIICVLARVFNIGWLFIIITVLGPVYAVTFFISNYMLIKSFHKSRIARIIYFISCFSIIIFSIGFPDFGGTLGPGHTFFGLIKTSNWPLFSFIFLSALFFGFISFTCIILGFCSNSMIKENEKISENRKFYNENKEMVLKYDLITIVCFVVTLCIRIFLRKELEGIFIFVIMRGVLVVLSNNNIIKYFKYSDIPKYIFFGNCLTILLPQILTTLTDNSFVYNISYLLTLINSALIIAGFFTKFSDKTQNKQSEQ